jgi:hypothetical protein
MRETIGACYSRIVIFFFNRISFEELPMRILNSPGRKPTSTTSATDVLSPEGTSGKKDMFP